MLGVDEEVLKSEDAELSISSGLDGFSSSTGSAAFPSSTGLRDGSHAGSLRNPKIIQTMITDIAAMWSSGEINEEDMDAAMQKIQEAYWEGKRKRRG